MNNLKVWDKVFLKKETKTEALQWISMRWSQCITNQSKDKEFTVTRIGDYFVEFDVYPSSIPIKFLEKRNFKDIFNNLERDD